jgi:FecR protein
VTSSEPGSPQDDPSLERMLQEGLRRAPLGEPALARIRAAAAAEWRQTVRPRPRWKLAGRSLLAAGLSAAIIVALVLLRPFAKETIVGVVVRAESGDLLSRRQLLPDQRHAAGAALHTGEELLARGPVLIELAGGGTLRVAGGARLQTIAAGVVALQEGEVYVDLPPAFTRGFVVRTPLGLIEHLGTQFDVAVNRNLRIRVREGSIRLRRGTGTQTAAAGTELIVPPTGPTAKYSIATHGAEWSWIEALEPDYIIENRRLMEFLQWTARETGRRVSFTDDHARDVAEHTLLHGSVSGMRPREALETVFATTSLRYDLEDDLIRVSSGG